MAIKFFKGWKIGNNTYKVQDERADNLGTASTKNSTSVVTSSSDLVESGAVKDIVGWGNDIVDIPTPFVNGVLSWNDSADTIVTNSMYITSPYIPIREDVITISATKGDIVRIYYTDENHNKIYFIGNIPVNGDSLTIPKKDGAKYIRFSIGGLEVATYTDYGTKLKANIVYGSEPYHASVEEYCASKQDVIDTVGWCSTVLDKGVIAGANVNGDGTINISTFSVAYFKVEANKKYTVSNCNDFTDRNLVFGYYVDVPVINAVSYNNSRTVIERGTATSQTVTAPIDGYIVIRMNNSTDNIRFEVGEVVTQSVEDKKADNSVIAPVENGTTASQAYAVGSHAIRNGAFITWKNAKAQGETINDASDYTSGDVASCLIRQATFNATSNANGNVELFNKEVKILCAYCSSDSNTIALPFIGNGKTYVHLRNRSVGSNWGAVVEESVTLDVYYID